jgi:aminoglycoside phosphotransferase (APT) family kinase protein
VPIWAVNVGRPDARALGWVASVLGHCDLSVLYGMLEGDSPWLLRAGDHEVVLRVGQLSDRASILTEVMALRLAAQAAIPAPQLLGHDDGTAVGVPLLLTERLPGSSQIPHEPDPSRLAVLGGIAARLHAVALEPSAALPARSGPIAGEDFARMRREQEPRDLLKEAETVMSRARPTSRHSVFVHGDLWYGNTIWNGGQLTGIVDWECAGAGNPGVDLGSLRCDAAVCYGPEIAGHVLRGWEQVAGREAEDVAYWDVVAALATPPDMGRFQAAISAQGRPDLDQATLLSRRDLFLRQALDRLH